jgi:integrase
VDAERFLADQEAKLARGEWRDPALGQVTLGDWSEAWLDAARPHLKPKTVAGYESLLRSRILPELGHLRLVEITPLDVQSFINGMEGLSPSRVRQAHVVLGEILEAAVRDSRIARNPARGVKLPRLERREAPYLPPEVVEKVAEAAPEPYGLAILIMGRCGLRFGELAALRRRSVDVLRRRLIITESLAEVGGKLIFGPTKTHASRRVPLPPSLGEALGEHLRTVPPEPDALLFTSPRGAPLRYSNFRQTVWRPALERAGAPMVGVHVLRHSAAAAMIAAGTSPKAVQQVLGHGSAAFTLTVYGHLFESDLDRLAEALDLSRSVYETGRRRDGDGTTVVRIRTNATENGS